MAALPTFKQYLLGVSPDDIIVFKGTQWRAESLLQTLTSTGSAYLGYTAADVNGTITLMNSGSADAASVVRHGSAAHH